MRHTTGEKRAEIASLCSRKATKHLGEQGRLILWDDMVNPTHNGNQTDYQWWEGGGRPQTTDGALLKKLVDHKVLWFSWAYCNRSVPGSWAGVRRLFNLSLFLTASRMVLPQDPSTDHIVRREQRRGLPDGWQRA